MKVISVILGVSATTALHYTEVPHCTAKIVQGITSVATNVQALENTEKNILSGIKSIYKGFEDVNQIVSECRHVADSEVEIAKNITTEKDTGNCLANVKTLFEDSVNVADEIVTAVDSKSLSNLIAVLQHIKNIENDFSDVRVDCHIDSVVSFIERRPCAKALDKTVYRMMTIGEDLKSVISDGQLPKLHGLVQHLMEMPDLVKWVGEQCESELQMSKRAITQVERLAGVGRRSIIDNLGSMVQKASGAVGEIQKKAAEAACFGGSLSIAKRLKVIAKQLVHPSNFTAVGTIEDVKGMHKEVNDAIVSCREAMAL